VTNRRTCFAGSNQGPSPCQPASAPESVASRQSSASGPGTPCLGDVRGLLASLSFSGQSSDALQPPATPSSPAEVPCRSREQEGVSRLCATAIPQGHPTPSWTPATPQGHPIPGPTPPTPADPGPRAFPFPVWPAASEQAQPRQGSSPPTPAFKPKTPAQSNPNPLIRRLSHPRGFSMAGPSCLPLVTYGPLYAWYGIPWLMPRVHPLGCYCWGADILATALLMCMPWPSSIMNLHMHAAHPCGRLRVCTSTHVITSAHVHTNTDTAREHDVCPCFSPLRRV
jgi:hypothetical protein